MDHAVSSAKAPSTSTERTLVARAGRTLRFVVGAEALPALTFLAPDAPRFSRDDGAVLERHGAAFTLRDAGELVLSGSAVHEPFALDVDVGDAQVFGFGEATGASDRNGARFRMMTLDTLFYGIEGSSYTAFPFFLARRADGSCTGVLLATTFPLDVTVGGGKVSFRTFCDMEGAPVDVIVLRGSALEIVRELGALAGKTFLPPAWALGFHQSRWSYKTSDAVLDVARRFRQEELPADVVHLDIHYMDHYRVFTWHPERFADPKKMHAELSALGFRTMAIIDPGVSVSPYPIHDELKAAGMLLEKKDGSPYEGKVWPGATVFPDFTEPRVREAWARFHTALTSAGVAGFWNDMNDPVLQVGKRYDPLAEDVRHKSGSHRRLRNTYANAMAEATVTGLRAQRPGKRPFVLTRSGFLGIQRFSAVWTGDNHSSWAHLKQNVHMALNLGLSGVPLVGADVGGFGGRGGKYGAVKWRPPAELFVRWMELGSLMPFFRVHCTLYAPRQEPWSFGKRALDLSRAILRRRYRLLPLLYRLALEAHETGVPLVRPLWLHHDVPRGAGVDQFLLGDALLAAPVLEAGAKKREVWLPPGSWTDFHTGAVHKGDTSIVVDAPLGTTPLFVRAGACLFLAEPKRNADETLRAPLSLEVTAPLAGETGRGSLFLDDGESDAGRRFVLDVAVVDEGGRLRLTFTPRDGSFEPAQQDLELRAPRAFTSALVDGERREMRALDLAGEDRPHAVSALRVPLSVREVVLE